MRPSGARRRPLFVARILALFVVIPTFRGGALPARELEKGRVLPKVECPADPGESYALYLPSAYDPARAWPVLVLFDSGARGELAATAFREGAERRGFILAASNTARNGPWEPIIRAARAVVRDVSERFTVDAGRIYGAGFSGGARAVSLFSRMIEKPVAGLIACGAGLVPGTPPSQFKPSVYLGTVGDSDFNYQEVRNLDAAFDEAGVLHRMFYFEGRHDWPAPGLCARTLDWLDVAAMASGARPKDEAFLSEVFAREVQEAETLAEAGRASQAADACDAILAFFGGLLDTSALAAKTARLKESKDFERGRKEDRKRAELESATVAGFRDGLRAIAEAPSLGPELLRIRSGLRIGIWKSEVASGRTPEDRALAARLLFQLALDAERLGQEAYRQKALGKAAALLEIAADACSPREGPYTYILFNYACVLALTGTGDKALDCLELAVGAGFSNVAQLESEKDFESIRDTPRFRDILARLKSRKADD
jgi:dienelactone hydrolase